MTPPRIRAYVPLTEAALAADWPRLTSMIAFAPGAPARALTGEELEEAEWFAQFAAAQSVAEDAAAGRCGRVVLACDVPGTLPTRGAAAGIDVLGPFDLHAADVVSAHVDDPDTTAHLPEDPAEAIDVLGESALLWYDASEIGDLVEAAREHGFDEGADGGLDG